MSSVPFAMLGFVKYPMPQDSIHSIELISLLVLAVNAPDLFEPGDAPFTPYDWERLCQLCQAETLYSDQSANRLVITARKGGMLKGNFCLLAGLLYRTAEIAPVASLEIRFSSYLPGPELYLKSLRSPFMWQNVSAKSQTPARALAAADAGKPEEFLVAKEAGQPAPGQRSDRLPWPEAGTVRPLPRSAWLRRWFNARWPLRQRDC